MKPYYYPAVKGSDAVAPHAGARIETCCGIPQSGLFSSLPMRERELKLFRVWQSAVSRQSLPMRERELKRARRHRQRHQCLSLPMRERVREAGLLCPRAVRYCRAVAGVTASRQHRTEK